MKADRWRETIPPGLIDRALGIELVRSFTHNVGTAVERAVDRQDPRKRAIPVFDCGP
jgi:hypothetical protein